MINKVNGLLGLCARARKIIAGNDAVIEYMEKGKVYLVIVAEDASEKTKKNYIYYASKYKVECLIFGNIEDNSKAIGNRNKAIIGILDFNLASAIIKEIHGGAKLGEN